VDIAGFLGRYPPFDGLSAERLAAVAAEVQIEHLPAGTVVLQQDGAPAEHLYVVRKGAVELLDDGRLLDLLGEGEAFGQFSLLAQGGPTATVRAHEDTLCYLIPPAVAEDVLGTSSGQAFVIGTMRERLRSSAQAVASLGPDPQLIPVGTLVRREPVTVDPDVSVAEAAATMAAERVSCLLIPMDGDWGILTDRDLRSRVVAVRGDLDGPVRAVASFPALRLGAETPAGEALLRMFSQGLHHFPVAGGDGTITGVVTDTDLMGLTRHTPFAIKSAIERADSSDAVSAAGRELPQVVVAMVAVNADPVDVGRVAAMTVDAMTERLLQLGMAAQGDPPCAWAWLALGSAARHEQALKTDQDHALAYDPPPGETAAVDPYFAELAEFVTAGLEAAGIPRCNGDAMATQSALRKPIGEWVETFLGWIDDPDPTSSVLASIGYDFRQVAGPLHAEPVLDGAIKQARSHPAFLRHLSRRALDLRPPTGFFRNLVVEHGGEHAGRLDVKHGGISIVNNLARAYAVSAGSTAKGTVTRLDDAVVAGTLDADMGRELIEAFHFLWGVRLRHQSDQVRAGEAPDDFVDPATLGPVARSGLKEGFRVLARAQRLMASELGVTQR
jgi:CBS domain-containing protein